MRRDPPTRFFATTRHPRCAVLFTSSAYATVNCTITGSVTLESQDSYYCDTDVLGTSACTGWNVKNLDTATVGMPYMYIGVFPAAGGINYTSTNQFGNWSLTFPVFGQSQCNGQAVEIRYYFARVHEADAGLPYPRFRFAITDLDDFKQPGTTWRAKPDTKTLTGPTTTVTRPWIRTSTQTTTRYANVYYTVNSMLSIVKNWSSNLDSSFTTSYTSQPFRIGMEMGVVDEGGYMTSFTNPGAVIGFNAYGYGGIIRDEIGHATHAFIHHKQRDDNCADYTFFDPGANGDPRGCEYGSTSLKEALSIFLATRSITSSDTKAWSCGCWDGPLDRDEDGVNHFDVCSQHANFTSDPDGGNDWVFRCQSGWGDPNPTFYWLGDYKSNSTANCFRLSRYYGCDCSTYDSTPFWNFCETAYNLDHGWRSAEQTTRFLWDMIDLSNDAGQDDETFSIDDIVGYLEAMPYAGSLGGVDGSCEEQAPPAGETACDPPDAGAYWPNEGAGDRGSRDSYNTYDLSTIIPNVTTSQEGERILNCVQGALD